MILVHTIPIFCWNLLYNTKLSPRYHEGFDNNWPQILRLVCFPAYFHDHVEFVDTRIDRSCQKWLYFVFLYTQNSLVQNISLNGSHLIK